jgi:hypothetical protein
MEMAMEKFTKIKELIAALQTCDPEGTVTISLDAALLFDDEDPGDVEYDFEPMVDFLFSRMDAARSDSVYFCLPADETKRIVEARRSRTESHMETLVPQAPANSGIVMGAPVAVAIGLSENVYNDLLVVVDYCNRADDKSSGATTHGKLDIPRLIAMLAEDAAMTNSRPGSWEGANLQRVLNSHGYQ